MIAERKLKFFSEPLHLYHLLHPWIHQNVLSVLVPGTVTVASSTMPDGGPDVDKAASEPFLRLRKRIATEERPAGLPCAVVHFAIGDDAWVCLLYTSPSPRDS